MGQGARILVAATLELVLALLLEPPLSLVLLYIGVATGLVGVAVVRRWTGLFAKRVRDGKVPAWTAVVFFPWLMVVYSSVVFQRLVVGEAVVTEVHPGWFLSGWPDDPARFDPWPAVVDMTAELPCRVPAAAYLCLPTWDGTAPRVEDLDRAAAFAVEQQQAGHGVLIHCAHGHGRSAAAMCAALVRAGLHPTWEEALEHLRERRPGVRLNPDQVQSMRMWAQRG